MKYFLLNQVMQQSSNMPNAEGTEKFYVVICVISILFAGIVAYLIFLDKKLKDLEKK